MDCFEKDGFRSIIVDSEDCVELDSIAIQNVVVCRAGTNPGLMADPPAGGPEPSPTNNQRETRLFTRDDFVPIVPRKRRSPRNSNEATTIAYSNPEFRGSEDNNGQVTTKEVRQLINSLKEIINNQTTLIESTKAEL